MHRRITTGIAALIMAFALVISPFAAPRATAATTIQLWSANVVKNVSEPMPVTVQVNPAVAGTQVHSQILIGGIWNSYDTGVTDATGRATINLEYRIDAVGSFVVRMVVWAGGGVAAATAPFTAYRKPYVTLMAAPGTAPAGTTIKARGRISPTAYVGVPYTGTGFTEAYVPGRGWLRSQQGAIDATGNFTLPLTYGAGVPGTYRYRLGATVNGATGYSGEFNITRTPVVQLLSAPTWARVGVSAQARGRTLPQGAGRLGFAEVWYVNKWARVSTASTNSSGDFYVYLNYGRYTAGVYTYRLGAVINGSTYYTKTFLLQRANV